MIYLFEDRKGRMQQYLKQSIENEYLKESIFESTSENIVDYVNENYSDAKCILFHKSYQFPQNNITIDLVKNTFISKGISFVIFSGGNNNNIHIEKNVYTGTVNSGDMYNHLNTFLNYYRDKSIINIPLLLFGEKFLLNSLLALQNKINLYLFAKKSTDIIESDDLDSILDDIKNRIKESELSEDKVKLCNWLESSKNDSSITVQLLKNQIQKLIDKY